MGCFDYECECNGKTCIYTGGQNGGDSEVVIEVPLNDGTTVYVKGHYNSYGSVDVGKYQFYPEQFEDFFEAWLENETDDSRSKIFLAKRIWTFSYTEHQYDDEHNLVSLKRLPHCHPEDTVMLTKLGSGTVKKLIRADAGLDIPSDADKKAEKIADLQNRIRSLQSQLDALLRT